MNVDSGCVNRVRLYSYVVARDYGFAPNPFFGTCSLATCKPEIRRCAQVGDWIVGTGSTKNDARNRVVYVMQVTATMRFDDYWLDADFRRKRPNLRGSKKQAYGDNIYHRNHRGVWQQENSHHSYASGQPNLQNAQHDTRVDRLLISQDFAYWGGSGPMIPPRFSRNAHSDIRALRGHRSIFPTALVADFVRWFRGLNEAGYQGPPLDWSKK